MENLECLINLRVLVLSHNSIQTIESIKMIPHLGLIDISYNKIGQFDIGNISTYILYCDLSVANVYFLKTFS